MSSAGSSSSNNQCHVHTKHVRDHAVPDICTVKYEKQTETDIQSSLSQQALQFLPPYLQAGGQRSGCQMSPILPVFPQTDQARVHMETDGSGVVVTPTVPEVDVARCSGCGRCVAACPVKIITLETFGFRKHAVIFCKERCTRCDRCVQSCPVGALSLVLDEQNG